MEPNTSLVGTILVLIGKLDGVEGHIGRDVRFRVTGVVDAHYQQTVL